MFSFAVMEMNFFEWTPTDRVLYGFVCTFIAAHIWRK